MKTKKAIENFSESLARNLELSEFQKKIRLALFESCVPKNFWEYSSITSNKAVFKEFVEEYAENYKTVLENGDNICFVGKPGRGKTFFLCYILVAMIQRGFSVYYLSLTQLENFSRLIFNDRILAERFQEALERSFVAVDDIGRSQKQELTATSKKSLIQFVKQRYDNGKPTLLGSDISIDALEKLYGKEFLSILKGRYDTIHLTGGDRRVNDTVLYRRVNK